MALDYRPHLLPGNNDRPEEWALACKVQYTETTFAWITLSRGNVTYARPDRQGQNHQYINEPHKMSTRLDKITHANTPHRAARIGKRIDQRRAGKVPKDGGQRRGGGEPCPPPCVGGTGRRRRQKRAVKELTKACGGTATVRVHGEDVLAVHTQPSTSSTNLQPPGVLPFNTLLVGRCRGTSPLPIHCW